MLRHGLTLGKFAPLHRGHQYLIETALAEVDQLTIVIYDAPQTTAIPLSVRADWLRRLYPQASVIEGWAGPTAIGDTPEIRQLHERYLIEQLGLSGITHFYSSEFYGDHISRAFGAIDRRVDPPRSTVPISATMIRQDPWRCREYLPDVVYRDLIVTVALLGAPSTGKTTLAAALADHFATVWMPEYGREYWQQHQSERRLTPQQLVAIAEGHLQREEALLLQARRFLFCDTNALTTAQFALDYHGSLLPRLAELADEAQRRYDLVVVCDDDIPYDDTWDRSGAVKRRAFQHRILADLHRRRLPYLPVSGTVPQRIAQIARILQQLTKFANPAEMWRTT